jgi:hypothetical protein
MVDILEATEICLNFLTSMLDVCVTIDRDWLTDNSLRNFLCIINSHQKVVKIQLLIQLIVLQHTITHFMMLICMFSLFNFFPQVKGFSICFLYLQPRDVVPEIENEG